MHNIQSIRDLYERNISPEQSDKISKSESFETFDSRSDKSNNRDHDKINSKP